MKMYEFIYSKSLSNEFKAKNDKWVVSSSCQLYFIIIEVLDCLFNSYSLF